MPRDRLDGIHTRAGRVVYDRPKHVMTDADKARIAGVAAPEAGNGKSTASVDLIVEVVDTMTEEMIGVLLARFGLPPGLADEALLELKKIVMAAFAAIPALQRYLEDARGPLGIPPGVF